MSFLLKDDELLEKYNEICENVKEFDSEPVYNRKYLKAKVNPYNRKIKKNFHENKIPKEDSQYISDFDWFCF